MTNIVKSFDYNSIPVRVIDMDGDPWFPAKDVCDLLGITNPRNAVPHACVAGEYKTIAKSELSSNVDSIYSSFPNRGMICVNESGLYALIFASRKPEARAFRHWVTSVVLPAIRKDGGYVAGEEKVATGELTEEELVLKVIKMQEAKVARLKQEKSEAEANLRVVSSQVACASRSIHKVARTLEGVNTMMIKRDLMAAGYLYHRAGQYRVYAKYQHLFVERINREYGKAEIFPTEQGVELLASLRREGRLTMKSGHSVN